MDLVQVRRRNAVLHKACVEGNVNLVQQLMSKDKANLRDSYNNTPLHMAALHGQLETALVLINQFGCDVNIKGHNGRAVLHQACAGGNVTLVQRLILEHKANKYSRDDENNTPLHVAALYGNKEVLLILINQFKCDVGVKGYLGRSFLHLACTNGHSNVVTAIGKCASLSAVDDDGNTPLHISCARGHVECMKALLALDAPILVTNNKGNTPRDVIYFISNRKEFDKYLFEKFGYSVSLHGNSECSLLHDACKQGDVSLIQKLILLHKADSKARDDENNTPLHVAALHGNEEAALTLINQFGFNSMDIKGCKDRSVLHYACLGGNINLIFNLIQHHKADITARDSYGNTPLHIVCDIDMKGYHGQTLLHKACLGGNVTLVQSLVHEHIADIEAIDDDYNTPLHVAALHGNEEAALTLINQFGFNSVDIKGYLDRSVLHQACIGGNVSLIETLILAHKASVTARDWNNDTPLHVAALHGNEEAALTLINQFGFNSVDIKGYLDRSVLHQACIGGNVSLVKTLILTHKASVTARDCYNDTPLHVAALHGNEKAALTLINYFGFNNVDMKGYLDRSVLHQACIGGNVSLVKTLILTHKASDTARDCNNDTPLHVAALHGNEEAALTLINQFGFNVDIKGYKDRSVLHQACKGGNVSLIETLILTNKASVTARDCNNDTPLHVAALHGKEQVSLILIDQLKCDVDVKGYHGRSALHHACQKGHDKVVSAFGKYASHLAVDDDGNTPLHLSCARGHVKCVKTLLELNAPILVTNKYGKTPREVANHLVRIEIDKYLIDKFGYSVSFHGNSERLLLHDACKQRGIGLIQNILEHKADVYFKDSDNNTPLHVAALYGNEEAALTLINQFGFNNVDIKGYKDRSVLHQACIGGNVSLIKTLIHTHKASVTARDCNNDTPLHVAALYGKEQVLLILINQFKGDVDVKGYHGRSALYIACHKGHDKVVSAIGKYASLLAIDDDDGNTPLHLSCAEGCVECVKALLKLNAPILATNKDGDTPREVARHIIVRIEIDKYLFNKFGYSINLHGYSERFLLHDACKQGDIALIQNILEHKADVYFKDDDNNTPLHVAALHGNEEAALTLINQFGFNNVDIKGYQDRSLLHQACIGDNVSLIKTLIHTHKASVTARDCNNDTPLHVAALYGREQVLLILIDKFKCDVDVKGYHGRSALHHACHKGHDKVVSAIGKYASLLAVDDDGNTPLHTCSAKGHVECVKVLLALNAPVLVRNKSGITPREIAEDSIVPVIDNYVLQNQDKILADYKIMQERSKKRYSKPEHITRIFVIGNPGAGKSSFVQCLKREGFFESFIKVSESSVPRHTAGIVPSEYYSKHYGRVLFYDFAGDPEYYSSHAAILENLSFLKKGDNIFVIIADLNENDATINNLLHNWFLFIQNQKFLEEIVSLVLIGSHVDSVTKVVLQGKKKIFVDFQKYVKSRVSYKSTYHFLDCRKPRDIGDIQQSIKDLTYDSPTYSLSFEASILLGLLEKDFKSVTACTLKILISHISETGLALPKNSKSLCPILHELHELGLLLVIGKSEIEGDVQIVLNISQLTNDVHRLLFSKASINLGFYSNFGIVPENSLLKILPKYITKKCLIQLQYCQEISHRDIGVFSFPSQSCIPDESFLFFPSLCSVEKSEVSWKETFSDAKLDYSIGWLAECTDASNHFPARFLHVLLLRLVFKFSFKHSTLDAEQYHHHCTLWKTGVQWPMEEGVLCMVELTDNSKKLVVVTKSEEALAHNCISVFNRIICCVMKAKAEFCHSIKPEFFLLATTEEANYLDQDNLIALYKVEEALNSPETKEFIFSITGKKSMRCSKISSLRKLTHWDSLFPIDFKTVLFYLKDVVRDLHNLSDYLNIPHSVMEAIEIKYPRDVDRWRKELVIKWMNSFNDPPCWWHLVEALKKIDMNVLATKIEEEYSQVELQKRLLDQRNDSLKPDAEFIELFSEVSGSDWPSLASLLLLTNREIEEVKEEGEGLSQEHHAHLMLKKWVSREDATYGQLYQKLKTISLFQY